MMYKSDLKATVRELGVQLGQIIQAELGTEWLARIEDVRLKGRQGQQGDQVANQALQAIFAELDDAELLVIGRAFAQFLNLANIAEQEFNSSKQFDDSIDALFTHLRKADKSPEDVYAAVNELHIDLVLTAHPTEVTRRTMIHKYTELAATLRDLHHVDLHPTERLRLQKRIADIIEQAWFTEEVRHQRPTPVDEATWGFSVIENSLWDAIPEFMRDLDNKLQDEWGIKLPIDAQPVQISSWMGGDRDGNPFVTHHVTELVLTLAKRRAAKLFARDITQLQVELSMTKCSADLRARAGDSQEPYRAVLRPLVRQLKATKNGMDRQLKGEYVDTSQWIRTREELLEPLLLCYRSLLECGMHTIAQGMILDTIRRAYCFGIHLLRLDIRQDSGRHADAIAEITDFCGLGDYHSWTEQEKVAFLLTELKSPRPLLPAAHQVDWQPSGDVKEVLDTCHIIAQHPQEAFGIYIISMASHASDVLAVELLLQQAGIKWHMPVAPLFETLDDLNNSPRVIEQLFAIKAYKTRCEGQQYVMIGYSDSAKDAGAIAAGWAQYQAQEALVAISRAHQVQLTLFHGRGGTIGRGGLPAHQAIHSQPPGSLDGGFRVTEQGETIRYKFGMPQIAKRSLGIYASAIIEAQLFPPPAPKAAWRDVMEIIATAGRDHYRQTVRHDPEFVPYFRQATPEQDLGKLPLGSRPAKRNPNGGVESLRAIPWIFAWAQTRMVLPAWLGVMQAIDKGQQSNEAVFAEMLATWPFFASRLSMLEMVFSKADTDIAQAYDERLVDEQLRHFGEALREELNESKRLLTKILNSTDVLDADPNSDDSLQIRADYLQPLHYLQIELLSRLRSSAENTDIEITERALMVAITGIAIGMRNTG